MQNELLTELGQSLVNGNLTDPALLARTADNSVLQILPNANVVKIGGQSFIDRGRAAVFPLIEEVVENLGRHQMIIGTGAGTRARHAYSVGIDLGMPTGVLSVLGTFVSMQNARMLHYLLAKHGVPFIEPAQFPQLPLYLAEEVTALGTLKLIMGLPLFAPLIAVTWLVVRALYPRESDAGEPDEA